MKLESDLVLMSLVFGTTAQCMALKSNKKCNFKEVTIFSSSKPKSQVFVIFLVENLQSGMRNEE